jgi:hypothetical protein
MFKSFEGFILVILVSLGVLSFAISEFDDIFMKSATITITSQQDLGKVISAKTYDGFFELQRTEIMTEKAGFTVEKLITPAGGNFELRHIKATNGGETKNLTEVCQSDNCFKPFNLMLSTTNK